MLRQIAHRQAQWARFAAWEANWNRGKPQLDAEEAVRAVGEIVEFSLRVSGGSGSARGVAEKAEAIRRLQRSLRFLAPVG